MFCYLKLKYLYLLLNNPKFVINNNTFTYISRNVCGLKVTIEIEMWKTAYKTS